MSAGPSLYRRHRPRTFADVVGQEHVVRTLSHAVQRSSVHHAYLFVGPRGTGKTSMAKILAACLNCVDGPTITPCGHCDSCTSIANATSLDVIEMDAASNNSVDDIRELREKVAYAPVSGRHKVYILDEAHMLSQQAWNAFLKTLEEPPPRTIFVLATTEAQKVLPTVVDRCHRFDFGRPSVEQVATVVRRVAVAEQIEIDELSCALVARHATGSFRDALGTLEQLVTYAGVGEPIISADVLAVLGVADAEQLFAAVDATIARDPAAALRAAAVLADSGRDPGQVLRDLEIHGRELLTVQVLGEVPPELLVTPERDERLARQAAEMPRGDAVRLLDLVSAALGATADGAQARIQLELVLVKAAAPQLEATTAALIARIERLEAALAGAGSSSARGAAPPARDPAPPAQDPAPSVPLTREAAPPAYEAAPPAYEAAPPAYEAAPPAYEAAPPAYEAAPPAYEAAPPSREAALPSREAAPPAREAAQPAREVSRPSPAAAGEHLDAIAALWPAVVDMVRGDNQMLASALGGARPISLSGGEVTVCFPPGAEFFKRKAEQDGHRRLAAEALRKVTGQSLALRYELGEMPDAGPAAPGARAAPPAGAARPAGAAQPAPVPDDELVRAFVEEFDAQELDHTQPDEDEVNH